MTDVRSLLSNERLATDLTPILRERVVVRYCVEHSLNFSAFLEQPDVEPALHATADFLAIRKQRLVTFGLTLTITPSGAEIGETEVMFKTNIPKELASSIKHWREEHSEWCTPEQFVGVARLGKGAGKSLPVTHNYFKVLHGFSTAALSNKMHELYMENKPVIFKPDIFAGAIEKRFMAFLGQAVYARWSEDFLS